MSIEATSLNRIVIMLGNQLWAKKGITRKKIDLFVF